MSVLQPIHLNLKFFGTAVTLRNPFVAQRGGSWKVSINFLLFATRVAKRVGTSTLLNWKFYLRLKIATIVICRISFLLFVKGLSIESWS